MKMKNSFARLLKGRSITPQGVMRFGIYAEMAGILVMSLIFVTHIPIVMVFAIPLGVALMGLGLLCWVGFFITTL
jgi:hypothetical protein